MHAVQIVTLPGVASVLTAAAGGVWCFGSWGGSEHDPADGSVHRTVSLAGPPVALAAAGESVVLVQEDGSLVEIDPTEPAPRRIADRVQPAARSAEAAWVVDAPRRRLALLGRRGVAAEIPAPDAVAVAAAPDRVWWVRADGVLTDGERTSTVGPGPRAAVWLGNAVWVGTAAGLVRVGTYGLDVVAVDDVGPVRALGAGGSVVAGVDTDGVFALDLLADAGIHRARIEGRPGSVAVSTPYLWVADLDRPTVTILQL